MNCNRPSTRAPVAAACLTAALVMATTAASAQPDQPLHCIDLLQLREAKVLDRQHIVFQTSNRRTYMNTLPHPCPGLDRDKPFLYRPTMHQLCDLDVITVLENFGGGFTTGASCGLGKFEPMAKDEAAGVLRKSPRGPRY